MPDIREIIDRENRQPGAIIEDLRQKNIDVIPWKVLEKEYNPKLHPVYTDKNYRDKTRRGKTERMTRVTYNIQKLAHEGADVHNPRQPQIHNCERQREEGSSHHGGDFSEEQNKRLEP